VWPPRSFHGLLGAASVALGFDHAECAGVGDAEVRAGDRDGGGEVPIVCDASSCTEGLRQMLESEIAAADTRYAVLRVVDAVAFIGEHVMPHLAVTRKIRALALHPTCLSTRMGMNDSLLCLAEAVADTVTVPDAWGCYGDRQLLHPELTASATKAQAAETCRGSLRCVRLVQSDLRTRHDPGHRHPIQTHPGAGRPGQRRTIRG
jgi:hypothetical protein